MSKTKNRVADQTAQQTGGEDQEARPMAEIRSFADLIARHEGSITVACDTEFKGPHTLSIQFAARLGNDIVVQVYSSPAIPEQPDAEALRLLLLSGIEKHCRRVIIRDGRRIPVDLSPARVLADLFGIEGVKGIDRMVKYHPRFNEDRDLDGSLTLTLVGHYWPADFFRVFGRDFFNSLMLNQSLDGRLTIQGHRLLSFKEAGGRRYDDPVLEYARQHGGLYAIKVKHFDSNLTFGKGKLDDLAKRFLDVGKLQDIGEEQKADMLGTFRDDPHRAYAYAIRDSILTLLVKEKMEDLHRQMYEALGFEKGDIPMLRSTQGSRVNEMILRSVARDAEGSAVLSHKGRELAGDGVGKVSLSRVKRLLAGGSGDCIAEERLSEFREQTGQTHGGLLFSRSPTEFFYTAPGMVRNVDLSSCYPQVMRSMSLYAGQPVIHEPGSGRMTLKDAVAFVSEYAAGKDAWIIKVSGRITAWPNALIPSTKDALTNANYQSRKAKLRAARAFQKAARYGSPFDWRSQDRRDTGNTAIYTGVVEAGVVAWPIWLMIQALPSEWRREYEQLEVDSILFYPAKLVAESGPAFDELIQQLRHEDTPWKAFIDMERLRQSIEWRIDDDYVSLKFDMAPLVSAIQEQRRKAVKEHGRDSAAARGWKEQASSLYGVLASPYLTTNNAVAANYITATARAQAFALQMSLSGILVITDGCIYRRDQVPVETFADCLTASSDYPINRKDFAGPFLDPNSVPEGNDEFTAWYREHVKRFFGVSGRDYDALFEMHGLDHKECGEGGPTSFDGLCSDGSANYVLLLRDGEGWQLAGDLKDSFKARSFSKDAKETLAPWLIRAYSTDHYDGLPPITESGDLLSYKDAGQVARMALRALVAAGTRAGRADPPMVYYPLGLERRRVQTYKVIKASAFLFRTPRQQAAFVKAMKKFAEATSCGLEALALRRTSDERKKGSLADVAGHIYALIREGKMNPSKALNLTRSTPEIEEVKEGHHQLVGARKEAVRGEIHQKLNMSTTDEETTLTGLFICPPYISRLN